MKYVGKNQPIETRKTIQKQQNAWNQLKFRQSNIDKADQIVNDAIRTQKSKMIIRGA